MIVKEKDLTGKQLSNYKIIEKLGAGGMATVYKAHELSLNRMVALKVLSPRLSEDTDFIKRFHREAQAAAQLNHPSIVQIYSIGQEEDIHYFAMEYVKGRTLADITKEKGTLPPVEATAVTRQVAEALGEAHKAGLVHRDIKPGNIMLDDTGRAKVADFGIAYVTEAKTKLTQSGSIIGTPEYLSPEQCEGKTVDGRSDIYSLGVTLYEVLTGKPPYEADTAVSMLMKIIKGDFLPIGESNPDVPKPIRDLVEKMMQTDPQNRYANTDELLKAIRAAEKAIALPETAVSGAAVIRETQPEAVTSAIDAHFQGKKKHSGAWAALTVAAIIVLLMGGAYAAKVLYFDKKAKESKTETTAPATPGEPAVTPDTTESADTLEPADAADTTESPDTTESVEAADTTEITGSTGTIDAVEAEEVTTPSPTTSSSQPSTSTSAPTSTSTSTLPAATPAQPVVKVKKPLPPANSVVVSIFGDQDNEDMIAAYVQDSFSRADFTVIDGPSVGNKKLGDIARYHLVMTVKLMATNTLNYYGSSTTQYTVGLTMKAIDTAKGTIAAGPITAAVKYTSVNLEENLKEAVEKLASRLQKALE